MKKYMKYIQATILALVISSCNNDEYLDVNTDPNNPSEVTVDLILPTAQNYTARNMYLPNYTNTLGNLFMANWSQANGYSWYYDEFNYQVNSNFYTQIWDYTYLYSLATYQDLINKGDETTDNYTAIAKIMKAFHFQMLVDAYGDVPYFEALQREESTSPAFDDAEVIYEDLIVEVDEAIELIKETDDEDLVPGQDDIIFAGDMDSWIRFANTLKLRILIRQSGLSDKQAYIQENINNIVEEGSGFLSQDALINPGYTNDTDQQNPFYGGYGTTPTGDVINNFSATAASEFVIDYLQDTNDPRIDRIFEEPATGHQGVPQGVLNYPQDGSYDPANVSNLGPGLLVDSSQSAPLMLEAESLFLQAEAAERDYLDADAQGLYNSGIQASFDYLGAGDASSYYSQSIENVNWNASDDKIEAIITQKWIALNGINGWEAWIEYNRTGYPSGVPVPLNNDNADRPVRLAYPSTESVANPNVPAQPNVFEENIFWAN